MANNPFEVEAIPRRVMPLIFMVDTSGSMGGEQDRSSQHCCSRIVERGWRNLA